MTCSSLPASSNNSFPERSALLYHTFSFCRLCYIFTVVSQKAISPSEPICRYARKCLSWISHRNGKWKERKFQTASELWSDHEYQALMALPRLELSDLKILMKSIPSYSVLLRSFMWKVLLLYNMVTARSIGLESSTSQKAKKMYRPGQNK